MVRHARLGVFALLLVLALLQIGCDVVAPPAPTISQTPAADNSLIYDAPVNLTIKNGAVLPGTTIGYGGKLPTGAAKVILAGVVAAKQTGDTLDWQGSPVPNVNLKLNTRVVTFDDQAVSVIGTAHVELTNIAIQPGGTPGNAALDLSAPVSYSLAKNVPVPGTNITYIASSPDGAQFAGIQGYAFRKTLDSLQYVGRVNPKVFLKLDLRVLNFTDTGVLLGGTANVRIDAQP